MGLWQAFLSNQGRPIHKWTHYFPAYEQHFSRYRNRPCVMWEIGVGQGGSVQMWKGYFGPFARIVGLDIRPAVEQFADDQIAIRIGDQSDEQFLEQLIGEFGPPDIVLDDGSHKMSDIRATFSYVYPRMSPVGVYMVEDLHTAYWPQYEGGLRAEGSFIEISKALVDELNADHSKGAIEPTDFTRSTLSMHFYDSIVVFERGSHLEKHAPLIGEKPAASTIRRTVGRNVRKVAPRH